MLNAIFTFFPSAEAWSEQMLVQRVLSETAYVDKEKMVT